MQSINSGTVNNNGSFTVSGINIIPANAMNAVGQMTMTNQGHQMAQPANIQLIIATKSLPQAMPVTSQQLGTQMTLKQEPQLIQIPVSATHISTQMTVKPDQQHQMITLPVAMPQVTTATMLMATPSAISSMNNLTNNNQTIITTSPMMTTNNVITSNNVNNNMNSVITSQVTVTGQSPGLDLLACVECGKHFVSVAKLKSHEKTHSKSRPFKCIDCNKSFTVRYSLICHTRTHTRERPYQCSQCGSRFTQASSLKTHQIYKHTKNFPYACKQCDRGFISPGQRHEHVVRTHLKLSGTTSSRSKSKSKSKASQQQQQQQQQASSSSVNMTESSGTEMINSMVNMGNTITISTAGPVNNGNQLMTVNASDNTLTLVNATILQPADVSTQMQTGQIDADQLPPGSTITLAIQAITAPDSDDSLGPSMSSAACQTSLSLPPLL